MGWMISVGRAGAAKGKAAKGAAQAMSMRFDAQGLALRVQVGQEGASAVAANAADAPAARQAQRVWRTLLATVAGVE